jgi:protein SCO1/2
MPRRAAESLLAAVLLLAAVPPAGAGVTPQDYRKVAVVAPSGAAIPRDAVVVDESGRRRRLSDLIARPSILVFADYTCTTLCGPIVAFVASALEQSGLPPGQFQVVVVGLDPKDGADAAKAMRRRYLGDTSALGDGSAFVTADAANVQRLTSALGYRYVYDDEHDQFVHPAAAFVLRADGRVSRVLAGLGISAGDMRLALVEAGEGRVGSFGDTVRLLCSGFDPEHGLYNVMISRVLAVAGLATVLAMGGGIGLLLLLDRRRRTA